MREPPGITMPYRNAFTRPRPLVPRPDREAKIDLGNVDHHPIGIIEGKGAKLDGLVEVEDKAGQLGVAGQTGIGRDREARRDRLALRLGLRWRRLLFSGTDEGKLGASQCCSAQ